MDLPDDLRSALATELATIPQKSMADAAARLSMRYRGGQPPAKRPFLRSRDDVIAYAAYRLPATYAALFAVLSGAQKRRPAWQPRSLLDAGSGPGTTLWAASELWPALEQVQLLERDAHMIAFGKQLAAHARSAVVRQANWQQVDLLEQWESVPVDIVTTSYVLGELSALHRATLIGDISPRLKPGASSHH